MLHCGSDITSILDIGYKPNEICHEIRIEFVRAHCGVHVSCFGGLWDCQQRCLCVCVFVPVSVACLSRGFCRLGCAICKEKPQFSLVITNTSLAEEGSRLLWLLLLVPLNIVYPESNATWMACGPGCHPFPTSHRRSQKE